MATCSQHFSVCVCMLAEPIMWTNSSRWLGIPIVHCWIAENKNFVAHIQDICQQFNILNHIMDITADN